VHDAAHEDATLPQRPAAQSRYGARVHDRRLVVLYEGRASGRRALDAAAATGAPMTVVTIAPRDTRGARCIGHGPDLEIAVHEAAVRELEQARATLGERAGDAGFLVLQTGHDHDLGAWAAGAGFTTALLGARPGLLGLRARDPRARSLARAGLAVRVVR
jgi:hypothetical protein